MSIRSFACKHTEALFNGDRVRKWTNIEPVAMRKLAYLHRAKTLEELRIPPANRLEALKGDRRGQHSIRINDQIRICFVWTAAGPTKVQIVDYH